MTLIASRLGVEQCPAALCRGTDGITISSHEVVEWRIKGNLGALVRGNGTQKVGRIWGFSEGALKRLRVFRASSDPGCGCIQAGLPHLAGIDDDEASLFLESLRAPIPELRDVVEGIQNGGSIALAGAAIDTNRNLPAVGESARWIVARAARNRPINRQPSIKE